MPFPLLEPFRHLLQIPSFIVGTTGTGKGGRNQEVLLAVAAGISGLDNVIAFSAGSDGTDGPTDAADGMVDGDSAKELMTQGIQIYTLDLLVLTHLHRDHSGGLTELLRTVRFINNTSIRMRLNCGDSSAELPGDVYAACREKHAPSTCTIMKLPHHGHKDSITPKPLDMLAPQHTVISVSNTRTDDCPSSVAIKRSGQKLCALYNGCGEKRWHSHS